MTIAAIKPAEKVWEYPYSKYNAVAIKAWVDAVTTAGDLGTLAGNALSADETGRAVMQTGYFTEAKATDAFVAGAITGLLLKAGALAATTQGRALMATGYFTEAKATDAFAAGAITAALIKSGDILPTQLATVLMGAPTARSGPGAIAVTAPTCLLSTTGTGDALTVADGTYAGQRLLIKTVADGGTGVITQTTGAKLRAVVASITFTAVGDWCLLEWSGALWNDVAHGGATIALT